MKNIQDKMSRKFYNISARSPSTVVHRESRRVPL